MFKRKICPRNIVSGVFLLLKKSNLLQTKLTPAERYIRHICDFSRGVLNTRLKRSYPTLAPRPQICLMYRSAGCLWFDLSIINSTQVHNLLMIPQSTSAVNSKFSSAKNSSQRESIVCTYNYHMIKLL